MFSRNFCFPSGNTVEQVRRNAKRLSKEQNIPLSKTQDQLACTNLGVPYGTLTWATALKSLEIAKVSGNYYENDNTIQSISPDGTKTNFPIEESINAFRSGIVAVFDMKDVIGVNFSQKDKWVLDECLPIVMGPSLVALQVIYNAQDEGRTTPNKQDWEIVIEEPWIIDAEFGICRYTGNQSRFKNADSVVNNICKKTFYPPIYLWIAGQLQSF